MEGRGGRMVNAFTDQISIRELGSVVLGVDVQSAVMCITCNSNICVCAQHLGRPLSCVKYRDIISY